MAVLFLITAPALISALSASASTGATAAAARAQPNIIRSSTDYHLLEIVPHDKTSFTQGLTYFDGHIYEGTGMWHESHIFQHNPSNKMETLHKLPLTPTHLFGEGVSHYFVWKTVNGERVKEHRLIQLTWKDKIGFIYSLPDLELIQEFKYDTVTGEGWGITFVEHTNEFYVSDGSEFLIIWDAETLEEKRRFAVTFETGGDTAPVKLLNELEFVDFAPHLKDDIIMGNQRDCDTSGGSGRGECPNSVDTSQFTPSMRILANVWYRDDIVSIDPMTGEVKRIYNLQDIYPSKQRYEDKADVLNGISVTGEYPTDGSGLELWITGKLWPNMYRIQLID